MYTYVLVDIYIYVYILIWHQHDVLHSFFFLVDGGKAASVDTPSRDPFVYLATCKIGHHVEVHLRNGSVYSGIFHAADVENNFGEGLTFLFD